jgi:hypothetical protein
LCSCASVCWCAMRIQRGETMNTQTMGRQRCITKILLPSDLARVAPLAPRHRRDIRYKKKTSTSQGTGPMTPPRHSLLNALFSATCKCMKHSFNVSELVLLFSGEHRGRLIGSQERSKMGAMRIRSKWPLFGASLALAVGLVPPHDPRLVFWGRHQRLPVLNRIRTNMLALSQRKRQLYAFISHTGEY